MYFSAFKNLIFRFLVEICKHSNEANLFNCLYDEILNKIVWFGISW